MVDLVKWVWTLSLSYTLDIFNSLFSRKNHIWSNYITTGLKYLQIVGDNHTQSSDLVLLDRFSWVYMCVCPDLTPDLYTYIKPHFNYHCDRGTLLIYYMMWLPGCTIPVPPDLINTIINGS